MIYNEHNISPYATKPSPLGDMRLLGNRLKVVDNGNVKRGCGPWAPWNMEVRENGQIGTHNKPQVP